MINPMILVVFISACMIGSIIQSVTGFGFGIFVMTLFPYFMPSYVSAVTLSSSLSFTMTLYVVYKRRKDINFKLLVIPLMGYAISCAICIVLSVSQSDASLKRMLGVFLFILSLYFVFFSDKVKIKPTPLNGFIAGLTSGALSGMFGAGGPPMVIYLMSTTTSTIQYLATIQCYFTMSNLYSLSMRFINGMYTPLIVFMWVIGIAGVAVGIFAGKKITGKVDDKMLKKLVYGFMAVSGLIMIFTA